jgi:predicted  nucleic acid-binding Zn-ribbon protein
MELIKLESILKEIKEQKDIIAKARDRLREIEEELASEADTFDQAVEDLENAIDLLSQYV